MIGIPGLGGPFAGLPAILGEIFPDQAVVFANFKVEESLFLAVEMRPVIHIENRMDLHHRQKSFFELTK
jgi:hypothetical protein